MLKKLAYMANELDKLGFYNEADIVTKVLHKIAQNEDGNIYDWTCPYCRGNNVSDDDVCYGCGRERNVDEEIEQNPVAQIMDKFIRIAVQTYDIDSSLEAKLKRIETAYQEKVDNALLPIKQAYEAAIAEKINSIELELQSLVGRKYKAHAGISDGKVTIYLNKYDQQRDTPRQQKHNETTKIHNERQNVVSRLKKLGQEVAWMFDKNNNQGIKYDIDRSQTRQYFEHLLNDLPRSVDNDLRAEWHQKVKELRSQYFKN